MRRINLFFAAALMFLTAAAACIIFALWIGFGTGDFMRASFWAGYAVMLCGGAFATMMGMMT